MIPPQLLALIDQRMAQKSRVNLAIDGPCGAGKSTLGKRLHQYYKDSALFHMDDFFLQPHQRTVARLMEPGGNVDRERFLSEVLVFLQTAQPFSYQRYDCQSGLMSTLLAQPANLNICEGVYSLHPELIDHFTLRVFLDIDSLKQMIRIRKRVLPDRVNRFQTEWIPMEQRYFNAFSIRESCDLILRL